MVKRDKKPKKYTARLSRRGKSKQKKNLKRKTYRRKTLKKRERVKKSKILIQNGGSKKNPDRPPPPRGGWGEEQEHHHSGILSCFKCRRRGSDYKIDSPEPKPEPEPEPDYIMWETAVASAWNGIPPIIKDKRLMDSYDKCIGDLTDDILFDDILSSLRCAYETGRVKMYLDISPSDMRCHLSRAVFQEQWFKDRYNIEEYIFGPSDFTGWFEFTELLNSGDHYLASVEAGCWGSHSFLLEFKNKKFRILSSWEAVYSFFQFPSISPWGSFDGHPDWAKFTNLMELLNGGPLLGEEGGKINPLESQISTWEWTRQELINSRAMFHHFFKNPRFVGGKPPKVGPIVAEEADKEVNEILREMDKGIMGSQWEHREFTEYPKGKVIRGLMVFLKINGLK